MSKQYYSNTFLSIILCILIAGNSFSNTSTNQNTKQFIVVIDPGHGGKDPGAVNKNIREKDVVLAIGLKLGKLINDNYSDVKVVFTRNTDVFVPLIERSRIANKIKADLFISLHANVCSTPGIRGTETFFLGPSRQNDNLDVAKKENSVILMEDNYNTTYEGFDPNLSESYIMFEMAQSDYLDQSLYFADAIQHQFKSRIETPHRGVKQAGFLVLRMSSMPSVLIETGFLSNQAEANSLHSEEGQHNIALSILEAFRKFKTKNSGAGNSKTNEVIAENPKSTETSEPIQKKETVAAKQNTEEKKKEVLAEPIVEKPVIAEKTKSVDEVVPEPVVITNKISTKESEASQIRGEVQKDKQIAEEKTKATIIEPIDPPIQPSSVKKDISNQDTTNNLAKPENNVYYCVQIAASIAPTDPVPHNFKGLQDVKRDKIDKYYRYYVGHESTIEAITTIANEIKLKFPQAFLVSFVEGKRIPLFIDK